MTRRSLFGKKRKVNRLLSQNDPLQEQSYHLGFNLLENLTLIKEELGSSSDLVIRTINIGKKNQVKAALVFLDGLIDTDSVSEFIMESLKMNSFEEELSSPDKVMERIKENVLTISQVNMIASWEKMMLAILSGDTILLIDGTNKGMTCSTKGGEHRAISEPTGEPSVRGPQESFSESVRTNTALVRRRIRSSKLWMETMEIGDITRTDVVVMYIKGIASEKIVAEVKERLNQIETDEVLSSNTVEEFIIDKTLTPWPTIFVTERPDVVAGNLMDGRVVMFIDGTPHPLIVPATWNQFFHTAEDYYLRWNIATFLRFIRYFSFFLTLLGPAMFVAFLSYHPELIPTPLLVNLAAQRQGIPFPVFVEVILMELTFEILREAGLRMPRPYGQAVSIVGALVIGEAAVQAGIVTSAVVIVVAATAIGSFTIPHNSMMNAVRMLRFPIMMLAGLFGIYGIAFGMIVLVAHSCSLRSFGIPYLAPFAPMIPSDNTDTILRLPKPWLKNRQRLINQTKMKRTPDHKEPGVGQRNKKGND